ncbi:MAG: DUF202 domain-containing protein [Candidatus Kapaibacterium sp.]
MKENIKLPNNLKVGYNLYQKFIEKGLPVADQLAAARSILANERTFLSYQRTALTLAVAGFSLIKFFPHPIPQIIGWTFLPAALVTIILGVLRYVKMRDLIRNVEITGANLKGGKKEKENEEKNKDGD